MTGARVFEVAVSRNKNRPLEACRSLLYHAPWPHPNFLHFDKSDCHHTFLGAQRVDSCQRCVILLLSVLLSTDTLFPCHTEPHLSPILTSFPTFLSGVSQSFPLPFLLSSPCFPCLEPFPTFISIFQIQSPSSLLTICLSFILFKYVPYLLLFKYSLSAIAIST